MKNYLIQFFTITLLSISVVCLLETKKEQDETKKYAQIIGQEASLNDAYGALYDCLSSPDKMRGGCNIAFGYFSAMNLTTQHHSIYLGDYTPAKEGDQYMLRVGKNIEYQLTPQQWARFYIALQLYLAETYSERAKSEK